MSVDEAYNFRAVSERLATAGVLGPGQLAKLGAEGYEAVINLLPADSEHAVAEEPGIIVTQGLDYIHIPVDFAAPTQEDHAAFVAAMQAHSGRRLLLHCAANYRVTAFYAIYAVQHLGWSRDQAYDFIADTWNLADYPVWEAFVAEMLKP